MSRSEDNTTNISYGEVINKTDKDAFGHEHQYSESTWSGQSLAHGPIFRNIPQMLDSLKTYKPQADDVWLLTYPRSGTNWLYEMLYILMSGSICPVPTLMMHHMLEVHKTLDDIDQPKSHRLFHTHIYPNILPENIFEGNGKVVSVIRNPLSMATSLYHITITGAAHAGIPPYGGTPREFMLALLYGSIPHIGANSVMNTWFEHTKSIWRKHKAHPQTTHVIFFEELKREPLTNIKALAHFLGKEYSQETYQQIVELTTFGNIAESSKLKTSDVLPPGASAMFFRKGQIDEWKEHLSDDDFKEFQNYFQDQLKDYPDLMDRIIFEEPK